MKGYIEGMKIKEGEGVEVVLVISYPLMPQRSEYPLNDEEGVNAFNTDHEKALHGRQCYEALHLGRVELTQEPEQ